MARDVKKDYSKRSKQRFNGLDAVAQRKKRRKNEKKGF